MSLIALGLCLTLAAGHDVVYAAAWGVIAAGWFGIGMWLWRKHIHDDDAAWEERRRGGRA